MGRFESSPTLRRVCAGLLVSAGSLLLAPDPATAGVLIMDDPGLYGKDAIPKGSWMTPDQTPQSEALGLSSIFEDNSLDYDTLIADVVTESVENDLFLAKDRYKFGDIPGALQIINKLEGKFPEHPAIRIIKCSMLLDLREYRAALNSAEKAVALAEDNIIPWSLLATCHMRLNQLDDAERAFRRVLRSQPEFIPAHRALGEIYFSQGQFEKGIDHFTILENRLPKDAGVKYRIGLAQKELGELTLAKETFQQAAELDPKFAAPWNELGIISFATDRRADAVACFRRSLELDPDNYQALSNLGTILANDGKVADAIKCWQAALQIRQTDARTWHNLLVALDPKLPEGEVEPVEVEEPDNPLAVAAAHYRRAFALAQKGEHDLVKHHFIKALQHNLNNPEYYNGMGVSLASEGQQGLATLFFRTALLIDPSFEPARVNIQSQIEANRPAGYIDPAIVSQRIEKAIGSLAESPDDPEKYFEVANQVAEGWGPEKALPFFERAVDLDPEVDDYAIALSRAFSLMGNTERAALAFAPVLRRNPSNAGYQHRMAWLLISQSNELSTELHGKILKLAKKAVDAAPEEVGYQLTFARAQALAGDGEQAMQTCLAALKLAKEQGDENRIAQAKAQMRELLQ